MMIVRVCTLAALSAAALLGGCNTYSEGGAGASFDTFTYISTPVLPQTITVIDTRTKDVLLTVEVPVGQQLVVKFNPGYYITDPLNPPANPDQMRWNLMPAGKSTGELPNELPVPDRFGRLVKQDVREPGELPDAAKRAKSTAAR